MGALCWPRKPLSLIEMRQRTYLLLFAILIVLVLSLALSLRGGSREEPNGEGPPQNDTKDGEDEAAEVSWPGLKYHGYFEVFDLFISDRFADELDALDGGRAKDWSRNRVHIANAAGQSNVIVVPQVVVNPRAYFYDPEYLDACVENNLSIILYLHTLAKYVYFLDPRPCTDDERRELFTAELRAYEEKFRSYRDSIMAIYVYDEPWVTPHNVTPERLVEMVEAASSVFWGKPTLVMFHPQGNSYSYLDSRGEVVRFYDWIGDTPGVLDIVGVDPYFYAYRDWQPPDFRRTGDQGMVERDVAWASSFGKPVMLVGQSFDPGASPFFERDNTDPALSIIEGFENWDGGTPPQGWAVVGSGASVTDQMSYRGNRSLLVSGAGGDSLGTLSFEEVHSVTVSLRFAVRGDGDPAAWFLLGENGSYPVRLGLNGRDLFLHNGAEVELLNVSLDVAPMVWHSLTIAADADGDRWSIWFDGDRQGRLPNAVIPSAFREFTIYVLDNSTEIVFDELRITRDWSLIPIDRDETLLYHQVAERYPQVTILAWYSYPNAFASSLLTDPGDFQVADVWSVHGEIWEMIE